VGGGTGCGSCCTPSPPEAVQHKQTLLVRLGHALLLCCCACLCASTYIACAGMDYPANLLLATESVADGQDNTPPPPDLMSP
jgi:hypothetical protein